MTRIPSPQALTGPWRRQRGVTSIEYALLGALVALGMVAGVTGFGGALGALFDAIGSALSDIVVAAS